MRRYLLSAIAGLCLPTLAAPAGADAAPRKCVPRDGDVIWQAPDWVVYTVGDYYRWDTYGCLKKVGRRVHLGEGYSAGATGSSVERPVVAGRYVAAVNQEYWRDDESSEPAVHDLKTGKRVSFVRISCGREVNPVLAKDGAAAFARRSQCGAQREIREVVRLPKGGQPAVVASGAGIDVSSLSLVRRTLLWLEGDTARSGPLD